MKTARKTKTKETDANRIRETGKVSKLREHILTESAKQSRERKLGMNYSRSAIRWKTISSGMHTSEE